MTTGVSSRTYLVLATIAVLCAISFAALSDITVVPVLGAVPLVPVTIGAAMVGWPLLISLQRIGIPHTKISDVTPRNLAVLLGLGAVLAVPAIAIDLRIGFPRDMNVPIPEALLFYPAISLVADVVFHLLPLAVLVALFKDRAPITWYLLPVVFVEPLFQALFAAEANLLALLVFASVSVISAAQLWLFRRYGFGAMIGLRLAFYLFWHVIWGTLRLSTGA